MRRLGVFLNISLDGYFADASNTMDWMRRQDAEWTEFAGSNASRAT